ncbi:SAMP-activating enzyme E1 [Candidatus Lokiarchaeum ossiferum]
MRTCMLSEEEKERYQRQILIIGDKKQESLKNKKILQVGAGGLGGPLILALVAAGVGEIILFENDVVSLSNLGRQILYKTQDLGLSKGVLAQKRLQELNPHVKITVIEEWLSAKSAPKYLDPGDVDYLVDASDNFETKFLVNDLGIKYNIPFTIAGIQGFEGQLISVDPHRTACYRCLFGDVPKKKDTSPIPVMSSTCGVVGSLQANEILKGLLNHGTRILNALLMIGLETGDFTKIPINPNPNCICQK